ncbi:MAG: Phosphoribosylformylglycinamidine synthase subunit PurS [Fimbriimonadaceae bacterium]|nr:Phosphoribosylformylglycinamidine synthase subunit PurS [Fimbriimonadaceae bacterium]
MAVSADFRTTSLVCQNGNVVKVKVHVSLKPSLLDSAGRTVAGSLQKLGFDEVRDVRIGKEIVLELDSYDEASVKAMCDKLLANPVIEDYRVEVAG